MCLPPRPRGRAARNEALSFNGWNTWGLSDERVRYVMEDVNSDVSVLTELHGGHVGRESSRIIVSEKPEPHDSAAGVALLLSHRASRRVMASGWEGSRVVWCRLSGVFCNQFVIGTYIPHFHKVSPTQEEIWQRRWRKQATASYSSVI